MRTAELFTHAPRLSHAIIRNGRVWLAQHVVMVESWAADCGIDPVAVRDAIDGDLACEGAHNYGTPDANQFAGRLAAVTSLTPNPARLARQVHCIRSWQAWGIEVTAVNTAAEFAAIEGQPEGLRRVVCDSVALQYDRPTQYVHSLIGAGIERGLPFLLLNSDIEIYGNPSVLEAALQAPHSPMIGVRYNHAAGRHRYTGKIERWGLDCFVLTPTLAATIPFIPFGIGKPVWDYWLPYHFRQIGKTLSWARAPFFYHEEHALGWSDAEWQVGDSLMVDHYGVSVGSKRFRQDLER